jgi:hypothetical protein
MFELVSAVELNALSLIAELRLDSETTVDAYVSDPVVDTVADPVLEPVLDEI